MRLNKFLLAARTLVSKLGNAMNRLAGGDAPEVLSSRTVAPEDFLAGLKSTDPRVVKSLLPKSCFRKRGPGVEANFRRAYWQLTPAQREVARSFGWIR